MAESFALFALLLAPFFGFIVNSFFKFNAQKAGAMASSFVFISTLASGWLFFNHSGEAKVISFGSWLQWENLEAGFSFLLDPLSLMMIFMVTGVSFLIHVFSIGYMEGDARPSRYFSYLNLFLFSMLLLILADNLLLMFVGWEGVGLCSYLLIGFWFQDKEKARAGMKAFIVNRVGDAGFLIGIFLFFYLFQSLSFENLDAALLEGKSQYVLGAAIFLLVGAAGKSAQIPLYVWLPDAMAGPTPVSALIHAATMVTAGVYLVMRTGVLFEAAPLALDLTALMGGLTLLIGAFSACRVWDIKKILAYSTISQLGYMFLALGVSAFTSSFFHLMTHAFFKALLFLSAGSLIHGLSGEQDIRKMGRGLRKKMPISFISFLIGALALMGIFPLSGFFSKDEILYKTFSSGNYILWALALLGAGLTAFYTVKMLFYVFFKKEEKPLKAHEGGGTMTIPLLTLCVLSFGASALSWPHFMGAVIPYHFLDHWLNPASSPAPVDTALEMRLALGSSLFILAVSLITLMSFVRGRSPFAFLSRLFDFKFSLDVFYKQFITAPFFKLSRILFTDVEEGFLQKGILFIGKYWLSLRGLFVSLQNGRLLDYVWMMAFGFLLFIAVILF